jgi:hypothetical protein
VYTTVHAVKSLIRQKFFPGMIGEPINIINALSKTCIHSMCVGVRRSMEYKIGWQMYKKTMRPRRVSPISLERGRILLALGRCKRHRLRWCTYSMISGGPLLDSEARTRMTANEANAGNWSIQQV